MKKTGTKTGKMIMLKKRGLTTGEALVGIGQLLIPTGKKRGLAAKVGAAIAVVPVAGFSMVTVVMLAVMLMFAAPRPAHAVLGDVISSFAVPGFPVAGSKGLTWDGSSLWYADSTWDTIYQLDPTTGGVISSFASPSLNPAGLAYDGTNLWNVDIFSRSFYTINPGTGASNLEFTKGTDDYFGLTWDGTNLWGGETMGGTIDKMDISGSIVSSFPGPGGASTGLTWDGTNLWISNQGGNIIYKVDPTTGATLDSFAGPGLAPNGLAFDGDNLWVSDWGTLNIYKIDDGAVPVVPPTPGPLPLMVFMASGATFYFRMKTRKEVV